MQQQYDAIYLSPHLDDVALSCGGQIYQRVYAGESVLVVTITAGDPPKTPLSSFAEGQHSAWDLQKNPVQVRRMEDMEACELLGADYLHWSVQDCIYRSDEGNALYQSDDEIFGKVHSAEKQLLSHLMQEMKQLPSATQVIAPLGLGNHVDHQLTRIAAEMAFGRDLLYYEDYPYAGRKPWQLNRKEWHSMTIPLTVCALIQRTLSISAYHSQVDHLFGSHCAMEKDLVNYIRTVGGERLWAKAHVTDENNQSVPNPF